MSYISHTTLGEGISFGDYSKFTKWSKIGWSPTVNTTISEMWSKAGAYWFPNAAAQWECISTSASDKGVELYAKTCDTGGNATMLRDDSEDFSAGGVVAGDCLILDKSGTTPEWGYITTVAATSLTVAGGFSSSGSCATARAYTITDKSAQTGAHAVKIEYLTGTYGTREEIVILNGATATSTVNTDFFRVNSFRIIATGSGEVAAGTLSLRGAGGGTTYSMISTGYTRARNAQYTVPSGKTLWVSQVNAGFAWIDAAKAQNQYGRIFTRANREPTTGFLTDRLFFNYSEIISNGSQVNLDLDEPTKLKEKTDIKVSAISSAAGVGVVILRGFLETN